MLNWRGHQIVMAKGDGRLPRSTWGLPYSTGRRETISVSRTLSDSKRILCVAGVQSLRACVTIGEDGGSLISRTRLVRAPRRSPFKVTHYSWSFVSFSEIRYNITRFTSRVKLYNTLDLCHDLRISESIRCFSWSYSLISYTYLHNKLLCVYV